MSVLLLLLLFCGHDCFSYCITVFVLPCVHHCCIFLQLVGGSNGSEYLDSVECYDPSMLKWVPVPSLPSPRFGAAAVLLSNSDHIAPMEDGSDGTFSPPLSP